MSQTALILVAAGKGERAGTDVPKQYYEINGAPLIQHTLQNLTQAFDFDRFCIVIAEGDARIQPILDSLKLKAQTVHGGKTRTESVHNGLRALANQEIERVFIHDAARPFVDSTLMTALNEALDTDEAAVPALKIVDACKSLDGYEVDRDQILRVQTPQAFHFDKISMAFATLPQDAAFTDDIAIAKTAGLSIGFTQGQERNFKVTYPEDFAKAEHMMSSTYIATGSGFDVHQFEDGGTLWLCGVPIECGYSLKGHSDADAGLHALTDAILGALAYGDIGDHFPPSDPNWKGAASDKFLLFAIDAVKARRGKLQHVDVTLICEKPKVKPYREAMRTRIAELCGLPLARVSVKATTTEKLGFTGRGEGLAAQATATIVIPE